MIYRVTEYLVCFVNVIATENIGANYLLNCNKLVQLLLNVLLGEKGDTPLRQNALGALQKFSLHRKPQTIMIEGGIIKWIINTLKNVLQTEVKIFNYRRLRCLVIILLNILLLF